MGSGFQAHMEQQLGLVELLSMIVMSEASKLIPKSFSIVSTRTHLFSNGQKWQMIFVSLFSPIIAQLHSLLSFFFRSAHPVVQFARSKPVVLLVSFLIPLVVSENYLYDV